MNDYAYKTMAHMPAFGVHPSVTAMQKDTARCLCGGP